MTSSRPGRVLSVVWLLAAGCGAAPSARVRHVGPMQAVMREGKTEARATLADFSGPGTYGVGAVVGLAGEVLIDDGQVFLASQSVRNVTRAGADAAATLLTTACVPAWREAVLAADMELEELGEVIAKLVPAALQVGAEPVPFVVVGSVRSLELHVVRGACPHAAVPPGKEPARLSVKALTPVRLVGFFAPGREGVMTHHGTALHVHAMVEPASARRAMGHLDAALLIAGARLRVPADR